jgi:transcriptional regulator with XRE-family HTH domain
MSPSKSAARDNGDPRQARELFGRRLANLRDSYAVTQDQAALMIDASRSKISRIESGERLLPPADLDALLRGYGATQAERTAIHHLAHTLAPEQQWWRDAKTLLPGWLCSYLTLEAIATQIRTYEVRFIPGLLQARGYAEAVTRLDHPNEAEVQRRVEIRISRQRRLLAGSTMLWAVIDEAALHDSVGGPDVMGEQIAFLLRAARHPNVRLQVLPTSAGGPACAGNSFSILRLPHQELTDIVYMELIGSALLLDDLDDVDPYREAMERVMASAATPLESVSLLEKALRHRTT